MAKRKERNGPATGATRGSHRAPTAHPAHHDSDNGHEWDTPTPGKWEVIFNIDSGATDTFVTLDTKLHDAVKCDPIEVEIAGGDSMAICERDTWIGWAHTDGRRYTKISIPCLRGDFHQNLLSVRACNRANFAFVLDELQSGITDRSPSPSGVYRRYLDVPSTNMST
jgi:hypothetical protein